MTSTTTCGEEIDQTRFGLDFLPADSDSRGEDPAAVKVNPDLSSQEPAKREFAKRDVECLCPFCGSLNNQIGQPCPACRTTDTTRTREASTQRIGPWYLLQPGNPDLPGVNFDDLLILIRNQQVTADTVLRGPTTGQLWRLASRVRGVSREFGQCYNCAGDIKKDETLCPHCDRTQTVPEHADAIRQVRSASKPAFRPAASQAGFSSAVPSASRPPLPTPRPLVPPTRTSVPVQVQPPHVPVQVQPPQTSPLQDCESSRQVRVALLAEPVVHVHSLSHPEPVAEADPAVIARPVVAELSEPHYPKDDLLTPRDLAKAFQLEFGPKAGNRNPFANPSRSMRRLRLALTGAAGLAFAGMLLWPLAKPAWDWINDNQAATLTPSAPAVAVASSNIDSHTSRFTMTPAQQPIFPAPIAPPISASATLTPTLASDPEPTASAQDDPQVLWKAALDAEATGHFGAAVWAYERIQSLPSFSWPEDLDSRLSLARKELKGDGL